MHARVVSLQSLKEAHASTQKQLSEGLATDERAEQLRLTTALRTELEQTHEEMQYLTGRTSALERKAGLLTTEIVSGRDYDVCSHKDYSSAILKLGC